MGWKNKFVQKVKFEQNPPAVEALSIMLIQERQQQISQWRSSKTCRNVGRGEPTSFSSSASLSSTEFFWQTPGCVRSWKSILSNSDDKDLAMVW
mmetsp:Transcript_127864/g.235253  ORF Transcript_127864/g.235253 Transcript_127864/m.235253 type:complete len:94 (-) Transcript_127864:456-737(-)